MESPVRMRRKFKLKVTVEGKDGGRTIDKVEDEDIKDSGYRFLD